jgi:hypothetical protein
MDIWDGAFPHVIVPRRTVICPVVFTNDTHTIRGVGSLYPGDDAGDVEYKSTTTNSTFHLSVKWKQPWSAMLYAVNGSSGAKSQFSNIQSTFKLDQQAADGWIVGIVVN